MDLIVVIAAFPIGWLIPHRLTAFTVYLVAFNFLFTFQSMDLVLDWANGSKGAFGGPFPHSSNSSVLGYGVVNVGFLVAGVALLLAGRYVGARRARRTDPAFAERVPA